MWSNRKNLGNTLSYRRLVLALFLSVILHLFLIGNTYFHLPGNNGKASFIEAELVLPKFIPIKSEPAVKTIEPAFKGNSLHKKVLSSSGRSLPVLPEVLEQKTENPGTFQKDQVDNKPLSEPEKTSEESENKIEDPGLIINPDPYKYIESEFDIRTDITAKVGSSAAGKAKIIYQVTSNGEQYRLKSLLQAKGLVSLFIPDLLQTSEGFLTSNGLRPEHYLYQFGNKKNKTYSADFDWESRKLNLHNSKDDQVVELPEGTQDLLSFMYQFMFVAPMQIMQLNITNGRKLGLYHYSFEGEEIVSTKMGDIQAIHLLRTDNDSDEKTELWLATDYQFVPVKIRKTENENKAYELLVTSLKTDKPTTALQ